MAAAAASSLIGKQFAVDALDIETAAETGGKTLLDDIGIPTGQCDRTSILASHLAGMKLTRVPPLMRPTVTVGGPGSGCSTAWRSSFFRAASVSMMRSMALWLPSGHPEERGGRTFRGGQGLALRPWHRRIVRASRRGSVRGGKSSNTTTGYDVVAG